MSIFSPLRRWAKDSFFQHEDGITDTPGRVLKDLRENLNALTPEIRSEMLRQADHLTNVYFQNRHHERIPEHYTADLRSLAREIQKLNSVEASLDYMAKHGGPPTRQTILDAVDRSLKQRFEQWKELHHSHTPALEKQNVKTGDKLRSHSVEKSFEKES